MEGSMSLWTFDKVTLNGDHRPRLDDVSIEIPTGITAIVGYSGAGKTSLLNLIAEFERPDRGTVKFHLPDHQNRLPLYWVPQSEGLWPHLTLAEHLKVVSAGSDAQGQGFHNLLQDFDLHERTGAFPGELSQGERARLAVVRALASDATVLVMDEPLVHVDLARLGKYWQAVRKHSNENGTSLVIATHSPEIVLREANYAVCLDAGKVMYAGDVEQLYYRPETRQLAEFLGPSNWLTPGEAADWLEEAPQADGCYRPEQVSITPCEESPLIVQSSCFAGSIAEVELLNERTSRRRTFFHRPSGAILRTGERVAVKALLALLVCLTLIGCEGDTAPQLAVHEVRHWSMPPEGRSIPAPRGICVGPNDDVYVLDDAGRVLVFDNEGQLQRKWMMPEYDVGKPEGICILKDGRIAVADTHYHRVVLFDQTGKVLQTLGSYGKDPGQFIYPVAIVQDEAENFYVCEYGDNDRVQKFTVDGQFILEFGSFGTDPGQFMRPSGIVWHAGRIYVVDAFNNRIQVFSDSGSFLQILGELEQSNDLHYPYDITRSADGHLYVIEYGAGRVSKIDLEGKLLGRFGTIGTAEGQFRTPWGLTIDSRSRLLVADTGNRRIVELKL
jgi:ABC-type multidrug transport system ATPase subunit/DNA-binding beta-propeller fold protein YncE